MPNVGDKVFAQWPFGVEWWYPGVICGEQNGSLEVQFDDGDRATLTPEQVRPLDVQSGTRVYCRWKGGGHYYPGRIAAIDGNAIQVDYDDGDKEATTVSMLRLNVNDFAVR